jgi:hypothetical protein
MSAEPGAAPARPSICLVLSTGRCGSTMVSNIIRAHPMALSVSELFSGLRDYDLSERELTGAEFWAMLSTSNAVDVAILRCQVDLDEMLYPAFDPRPGADRFSWATGLPPIMQACVPHLTERPDDLYAELETATPAQPRRLLSEHLWWLFGRLADGRQPAMVVERSGGSLAYATAMLALFPQARVVHLYRDGRECAVSMSGHARYRFAMIQAALTTRLGFDPYTPASSDPAGARTERATDVPGDEELTQLLPGRIDQASYERYQLPLSRYGGMWTKMIAAGLPQLPDPARVLALDYADLTARPEEHIGRLLDFLGLDRDPLLEKQLAAEIRPGRDVRADIGEQRWTELTRACALGMNRLYGRHGWS